MPVVGLSMVCPWFVHAVNSVLPLPIALEAENPNEIRDILYGKRLAAKTMRLQAQSSAHSHAYVIVFRPDPPFDGSTRIWSPCVSS